MASDSRVATLRATVPALLGVAVAIVVPVVLALVGMMLVGSAEWIERMACTLPLTAPCPGTGTVFTGAGVATLIAAVAALIAAIGFVRRRRLGGLVLPALALVFSTLAVYALLQGEGLGNAFVELSGFAVASGLLSHGVGTSRLLHVAVLAQVVDLATFGPVWQLGDGEANPIGRLTIDALAAFGIDGDEMTWLAGTIAGAFLIAAKLALIGFLIRVSPYLHRYRRPVLLAAAAAGTIGATANLLVIL